ncbi:MOSC domain-containing protein [Marisediminicola sp. LYQ85]|uniref:MOSC domain-containing protein n=1 Tax=Marisediminicola sp. LYQ85 TaxID=3391062 RepID=UPI0039838507
MTDATRGPRVVSVSRAPEHYFSKAVVPNIRLIEGIGVEGDAHAGGTTQHRYLLRKDPGRPNLTQVHLLHSELFGELVDRGFDVSAGELGENVTTAGLDILTLPLGTRLHLGADAVVEVTGLRSPCKLINGLRAGLMKALVSKGPDGEVLRESGIMSVVVAGGEVRAGDHIRVELPAEPHVALGVV